ncbi:MAG: tyrosine-type recombinase/integrase [Roseibium sp.]|uniref:DUF6538 domain-containing protein n=1 Tax=Roseibium sp. TaxID=1936156 RepID=UPI003D9C1D60
MPSIYKRGNVWGYQRGVPKDLRAIVGKTKIQHSLKTDSQRQATVAGQKLDTFYDEEFRRLRSLDAQAIKTAQIRLADLGVVLEEPVYTASGSQEAIIALAKLASKLIDTHEDRVIDGRASFKAIGDQGLREIFPDPEERRAKVRALQKHLDKMGEHQLEAELKPVEQAQAAVGMIAPKEYENAAEQAPRASSAGDIDLIDTWVAAKSPTKQTEGDTRAIIKGLMEYAGVSDLLFIEKSHVAGWLAALRKFPARRKPAELELTFNEVLNLYKDCDYPALSSKSVQKRFNLAQAVFTNALKSGLIEETPFNGITSPTVKRAVDRKPFTPEIVRKIFTTEPLDSGPVDGFYWTAALALASGMRLGEICLLTREDLFKSEGGVWYFDLTTKKLKTESSRRRVPIHKDLVAANFTTWSLAQASETIMGFKPDVKGSPSGLASKKFNRWFKRDVKLTDDGLVFHSFRHTFKDLCREAGIPSDVHSRLTGHAPGSVGDSYGDFPLAVLSDAVNKIKLPVPIRDPFGRVED